MKNFKFKSLSSMQRYAATLLVFLTLFTTHAWATARTFKSGEKIYFKDEWKAKGNASTWKTSTNSLAAYFYGDGDGWYICTTGDNVYGSFNAENTIYQITVPGDGKEYTAVIFVRGTMGPYDDNKWSKVQNQTTDQTPGESYNIFYVTNSQDNNKYTGSWGRYAHNAALVGEFNNWNPDTYPLSNSGVKGVLVPLAASTTYNFKILLGETYYGINSASTITSTLTGWWTFYSGQGDVPIETNVAGDYGFAWNASSHAVTVYYPDALYPKSTYIYFDASRETYWNAHAFTARFYLKYFDSGSDLEDMPLECSSPIEDYVYYVQVPNNGYIGHIQLNRYYNSNVDGVSNVVNVYDRASATKNCLIEESDKENYQNYWTPQWTTYCPPTTSETFSDNSTSKISWQSGSNDGSTSGKAILVKTGTKLKVSASASKSVNDGNMTIKYDFKVNDVSQQISTTATYSSYTASTNNTTYKVSVDAYTNYNLDGSANSTKHTPSAIYYKALNTYSVGHSLSNISWSSGRTGTDAAAYSLDYTATLNTVTGYNLPDDITITAGSTDITANCTWNSSTGAITIPGAYINGNLTITASGVAKTYTAADNLDKNGGDSHGKYTATFDATTIAINTTPTKTGYHVDGYYGESGKTTYIADASGNLQASKTVSGNQVTDANKKWKRNANITLFTKWTPNAYSVRFNSNYPAGAPNNGATMSNQAFTYDAAQNLTTNAFACEGYTFAGWATSEDGSVAHTDGKSVSNLTTVKDGTVDLYAKWTDNNEYYFKGATSTDWNTASNWTKGAVPNDEDHKVYIFAPVKISSGTVHVKSVDIITAGTYDAPVGDDVTASNSKLTIGTGAMLIVDDKIQNYDRSTSKADSTRASTLHIESGATGNGALVWGETNSTPGYAQVDFYTKSHGEKDQNSSINQYIGTPFSNEQSILYQYYYSWIFKITRTGGEPSWDLMASNESMNEFEGYNLMTAYDAGTTYQMEGILVSNADVTLSTSSATGLPKLVYTSGVGSNPNNENVLANSWVAPIKIKNMNVSGVFTNIDASIYIFNAGSVNDAANKETLAGNYSTYSVGTAYDTDVIPSMQSFSVYANAASPVLFLDYSEIVQKDASNSLIISNKAPQREAEMSEEMNLLKVRIEGENGWADELKIYIREDFSTDFENGWDAHKMYGYPEAPQLYAVTTDGNMAINCVPTADNNVLGFTPGSEDNEYTFSFTYDGDEEYYLKDTKLNIETLINTEATYTFTSEAEDSEMRFIIIKRAPAVATDVETVSGDRLADSGVQKIMHNGQLYIIRDGEIYDATGTMVK